ncbi:hypothetical protein SLH49_09150 [Cognatiyoonia sp. IB215446]|uniref:hypothetical protein n=1 Tax=Cognatiyoonia sp. IB215446 TaxID=3097355 RepID=UPI002A154B73|nr:hypothetical protein [Cognatiyoonia sp. IB215446]MDX8348152.1 hypothetical protein [Cognatiyoonia sp. IB215446]
MRLTVLAFVMLPMAAFAQNTTLPAPTEPIAQSQTCAVGTTWDAGLQTCVAVTDTSSPLKDLSGHGGCNYGAAREVTS